MKVNGNLRSCFQRLNFLRIVNGMKFSKNLSNKIMLKFLKFGDLAVTALQHRRQGSTNCAHGDERARNVHAKGFSLARNYVHVNQSKHL